VKELIEKGVVALKWQNGRSYCSHDVQHVRESRIVTEEREADKDKT